MSKKSLLFSSNFYPNAAMANTSMVFKMGDKRSRINSFPKG
ncbi:hypothetical protein [Clostridium kluyveri]|nr:hypothetical protein [Clostridium kluyveri]